jgi:hypothetical protein
MADPGPDDLGVLAPRRVEIPLGSGGVLVLTPIRVRQLQPFVSALGPLRDLLAGPDTDLWDLLAEHGDNLTAALAIACDVPADVIGNLEPGEYMDALNAMLRVNASFFLGWLLAPILRAAQIQMRQGRAAGGPT